jgi:hypothetical protein
MPIGIVLREDDKLYIGYEVIRSIIPSDDSIMLYYDIGLDYTPNFNLYRRYVTFSNNTRLNLFM